ncbi:MAG: stage II sporulation protein M [Pirellula sp.]
MKIAELLEQRRQGWVELERMCDALQSSRFPFQKKGSDVSRFSALYRAACTDLAMADQYQLPPTTVEYLHRLVGRAHSQLYRSRQFPVHRWTHYMTVIAPQSIFRDPCVKVAFVVFFGLFTLSAILAWSENRVPGYAERILGSEQIEQLETNFDRPLKGNFDQYVLMSGFYIKHNTSIGLQCFALGPLVLPSLCALGYNGVVLGASFGYMTRAEVDQGDVFFQFVTAHGVFELTAIALSAAAGLRLGVGLFATGGLRRIDSFRLNAERSLPIIMASVVLFIMAAFTEGFVSPSPLPYFFKATYAIMSSSLLMYYFVVLGYPRPELVQAMATSEDNPWRTIGVVHAAR